MFFGSWSVKEEVSNFRLDVFDTIVIWMHSIGYTNANVYIVY